jgi:hypothetical protein
MAINVIAACYNEYIQANASMKRRKDFTMKTNNDYTKEYQNIALMTAVAAGEYWSYTEVNDMRELKKANVSNLEIAQLLGRSYYAICTKLSLVGLDGDISVVIGDRRNSTPVSYVTACSECFILHNEMYDCA